VGRHAGHYVDYDHAVENERGHLEQRVQPRAAALAGSRRHG